jgi:hypothetical protein
MFGRLRSPSGDMPPYRSSLTGVQLGVGADGKQLVIRTAVIPCYFDVNDNAVGAALAYPHESMRIRTQGSSSI